ncbi:MAG: gas vesicle protein GvpG [Candidatus Schekmanbacteria bacterium]|nr:gas vesicle protein GvpG [Candidatus Schekmanbacteria bacterium]
MLLVDDLLTFPVRGLLFVFREIHQAVRAEADDADSLVEQLQELYMQLETGRISESEFDALEADLLDRLDRVKADGSGGIGTDEQLDEQD